MREFAFAWWEWLSLIYHPVVKMMAQLKIVLLCMLPVHYHTIHPLHTHLTSTSHSCFHPVLSVPLPAVHALFEVLSDQEVYIEFGHSIDWSG